ncbi:hypothetical protein ABK040_008839 [Willaertia magna]
MSKIPSEDEAKMNKRLLMLMNHVLSKPVNRNDDKLIIKEFLNKFESARNNKREEENKNEEDDIVESSNEKEVQETKEEFEEKKRKLLMLLDQAVEAKMKITKAFPEKLEKLGPNFERYNLNWHPGWREPERFVPEIDCDPYRGACSVSSCSCQLFQSWPVGATGSGDDSDALYVYNPKFVNPETELCRECFHLKSDHYLATKVDKHKYKEFSNENLEKYNIQISQDLPPKHPSEIPSYELIKFYEQNPTYNGASPFANKMKLLEIEEEGNKKKKGSAFAAMYGEDEGLLGDEELFEEV